LEPGTGVFYRGTTNEQQRPVRAWLRKVEREYTRSGRATRKAWEDSVIATNNLLWVSEGSAPGVQVATSSNVEYSGASRLHQLIMV